MMHSQRIHTYVAATLVASLLAGLGGWLFWSYYGTETIVLSDGRPVPDLSVSEAPDFAGEAFEPLRRDYLEKLAKYRQFDTRSVPTSDLAKAIDLVGPLIERCVRNDPRSRDAVAALPDDAEEKLAEQVGLAIARLAGLPRDAYETRLPDDARLSSPRASGTIRVLTSTYAPGGISEPPPADASEGAWHELFNAAYALNREYGGGKTLIRAIGNEPGAFECAIGIAAPTDDRLPELLKEQLDPEAYELLVSGTSQAQAVFNQSPEPWTELRKEQGAIPFAQIAFIIENRAGDRYPLSLLYFYDARQDHWWLHGVTRKTSLRAMSTPAFVF